MKFIQSIFILLLMVFSINALGQSFKEDLKKVDAYYKQDKAMAFKIVYSSFQTHTSTVVEETQEILYVRKGNNSFYLETPASASLYSHGKTIVVNPGDKQLMVLNQPHFMDAMFNIPLDSLLQFYSEIKLVKSNSNQRQYKLSFKPGLLEYNAVNITVNTHNWSIDRLVAFYETEMPVYENGRVKEWVKPRLQIDYKPLEPKQSHLNKLSIDHYVTQQADQYVLSQNFREYELIDQSQAK